MTRRDLDAAIAALARRQHGAFNRAQALALGFTPETVQRRLDSGQWLRLDPSVYALPGNPPTWFRQCMAATLGEPEATVSGRAAAALHRFPGFRAGRITITVPRTSNHRTRLAAVRQSDLVESTVKQAIPVITVAQAVIEVARYLDDRGFGLFVGDLIADDPRVLVALRERYVDLAHSRWPGIGRVRSALAERGDGYVPPESRLEAVLWEVLAQVPGLPRILPQASVPWCASGTGRVDILIPAWRLIVEADGRRWHTRVEDFERDHERDNEAAAHGYRTLRFTWHQLTRRDAWVRDILERSGNQQSKGLLVA